MAVLMFVVSSVLLSHLAPQSVTGIPQDAPAPFIFPEVSENRHEFPVDIVLGTCTSPEVPSQRDGTGVPESPVLNHTLPEPSAPMPAQFVLLLSYNKMLASAIATALVPAVPPAVPKRLLFAVVEMALVVLSVVNAPAAGVVQPIQGGEAKIEAKSVAAAIPLTVVPVPA